MATSINYKPDDIIFRAGQENNPIHTTDKWCNRIKKGK